MAYDHYKLNYRFISPIFPFYSLPSKEHEGNHHACSFILSSIKVIAIFRCLYLNGTNLSEKQKEFPDSDRTNIFIKMREGHSKGQWVGR